jgi:acyl carrier protein
MTTERTIIDVAAEVFGVERTKIQLDTPRSDVGEWDSFAHLALITLLEERTDIVVPIERIADITTLRQFLVFRRDA